MKIVSAVSAAEAMLPMSSKIAAIARFIGLFPSFQAKMPVRRGRKFFLPSSGVFIESAHTVSAARATLTICSSETATTFRRFYEGEKLAVVDQFETGPLTLWRTFFRAGQIGCRSNWRFAAW
jgi:hypothetical protein